MGLACTRKSDGSLIEYQSAGTVAALTANALSAGFTAADIDIVDMTDLEMRTRIAAQPAAVNAAIQAQIDALEKSQGRALREAAIGMVGATDRLKLVDGKIATLRATFLP